MRADDARGTAEKPRRQPDDDETFEVQQLNAMQPPNWNEARLDDLNAKVDKGFERMDKGFERMDERFERMQARLLAGAVAIIAALIASPHL